MQSVLRCEQCNKPFDKQSTLKRHGYYCRSRKGTPAPRSRSCISCARVKARCDTRRPTCSRCAARSLGCCYPLNVRNGGVRGQNGDDVLLNERRRIVSGSVAEPTVSGGGQVDDVDVDTSNVLAEPEFLNLDGKEIDWENLAFDFDFTNLLNQENRGEAVECSSPEASSLFLEPIPSITQAIQGQKQQHIIFSPHTPFSIPRPPSTHGIRSLVQRPKVKSGAQRIASLAFHTLKSYPLMLRQSSSLPPFVHPSMVFPEAENTDMEPLTNCMSLFRMISSGIQGSRKLFWKNVRLECERICEEHPKFNKRELLAAMQALLMYILIRIDEGETDYNNFDFLLLSTVTLLAKHFASSNEVTHPRNLEKSWKDWIFEESVNRLCTIYQTINLLVYFEPAQLCSLHSTTATTTNTSSSTSTNTSNANTNNTTTARTDLILAPLPAAKSLWEARDTYTWRHASQRQVYGDVAGASFTEQRGASGYHRESRRMSLRQPAYGLAAGGELVRLGTLGSGSSGDDSVHTFDCSSPSPSPSPSAWSSCNWEEWCAGMDAMGGLVMLAAALV